jgi:ABC-2 type transport system permease protein
MWAIVVKEFRQLRRDRRTVAMLFMLPFVFLVVFGYAASFDVKEVRTLVVGPRAEAVAALLPKQFDVVAVRPDDGYDQAYEALRDGEATVTVITPADSGGQPRVLVDGTELFAARTAVIGFSQLSAHAPAGTTIPQPEVLFNPDLRTSVIMIPGLCGIILVFVGTLATALGVVRERQAGTLEQLAVMPFRPRDIFVGKIAPYLAIAAIDMVVIVGVGMLLFDVPFRGSVLTFALGAALFLFVTLGIGVLISTVSQTQGQAIQLTMMTIMPQFLLSGLFFPLYSMAPGVRWIGYLLPLTYFVKIARGVMVRGEPFGALWLPMLILALMAALVFTASVLRFRRDLAPAKMKDDAAGGAADAAPPAAPPAAETSS